MTPQRIKSTGLANARQFEDAVNQAAADTVAIRALEARRDKAIQRIQERYNAEIKDIATRVKGTVAQAEKYALAHRAELLDGRKSADTVLARWGFRVGQPTLKLLNRKWAWAAVVDTLKAIGRNELVVVKEAPDKDAIKAQIPADQLASIGCKIEQTEAFWIEPKLENLN